jgi:hypothetical protein
VADDVSKRIAAALAEHARVKAQQDTLFDSLKGCVLALMPEHNDPCLCFACEEWNRAKRIVAEIEAKSEVNHG